MGTRATRLLLAAGLLGAAACGDESTSTTWSYRSIDSTGGMTGVTVDGVALEVGPDVSFRLVHRDATGEEPVNVQTLNGHPFELRGGELLLAGESYGPVAEGGTVAVTAEGVFVDGERRGDTPARADGDAGG